MNGNSSKTNTNPNTSPNTPPTGWDRMGQNQSMSWDDLSADEQAYQRWLADNDSRATSKGTYLLRDVRENQRQEGESTEAYAARLREIRAAREASQDEFAGERDVNDKTGKERSFHEWDLYPRQKGETPAEYGARLKKMHEMTKQYEAEQTTANESEQIAANEPEQATANEPEQVATSEPEQVAAGEVESNAAQETDIDKAEEIEIDEAKEAEIEVAKEAERQKAISDKENSRDKIKAELARRKAIEDREESIDLFRKELESRESTPLTAVNADFTLDRKDLAHDLAEQELNADVAKKGIITRIWKGNLFKKYYQKKYERQILSGERKVNVNGEEMAVDDMIERSSDSGIKRFIQATVGGYESLVHDKAGESLEQADPETTAKVRAEIEWFASAKPKEGQSLEDLRAEFNERIKRIKAENRDDGKKTDEKLIDNYYEVALQARERFEHGVAMEKVMDGFAVYNAKVRNGIRTEAHRDRIDRIVNKYESSALGQFIPPEFIAAALGSAQALTQTGVRALAGAGAGIGASAVFSGLRERNRVTEDRARMQRDLAMGLEHSGRSDSESEEKLSRAARKREKYEARLGGTLYDLRPATELTAGLNEAIEKGDSKSILQAIAEAEVRVDYSDKFPGSEFKKDLIAYSSADKIGDERLALDLALIRAKKNLSPEDQEKLKTMQAEISKSIAEEVEDKDTQFKRERRKLVLKAAMKTATVGAATFFASQEVSALFDSNKIGIFEKAGLVKTENADTAEETILAGALGGRETYTQTIENISGDRTVEDQRYQEAGFERVEKTAAWTETKTDLSEVDAADSTSSVQISRSWAHNGTRNIYEGNELGIDIRDGQMISNMSGISTGDAGRIIDVAEAVNSGDFVGVATTADGSSFLCEPFGYTESGAAIWTNAEGMVQTTSGDLIQAVSGGENVLKYFEVAVNDGLSSEGVQQITALATATGSATSNTVQQVTETIVEHPAVYDYVKTFTRNVNTNTNGLFVPIASRVGLGAARNRRGAETPRTPENPANPTPEGPSNAPEGAGNSNPPENPSETEPGSVAAPASPEATSGASGEASGELSPEEEQREWGDFVDRQTEALGSVVYTSPFTNQGLNILRTNNPEELSRDVPIEEWWDGLDSETQEKLRDFEADEKDTKVGTAFRSWLEDHPETKGEALKKITEQLGDAASIVGNNGINILAAPENTISTEDIVRFWNSLDDDTKNAVRNVVNAGNEANSQFGVDFRNWLNVNFQQ